jgi:hypothetical protein
MKSGLKDQELTGATTIGAYAFDHLNKQNGNYGSAKV